MKLVNRYKSIHYANNLARLELSRRAFFTCSTRLSDLFGFTFCLSFRLAGWRSLTFSYRLAVAARFTTFPGRLAIGCLLRAFFVVGLAVVDIPTTTFEMNSRAAHAALNLGALAAWAGGHGCVRK